MFSSWWWKPCDLWKSLLLTSYCHRYQVEDLIKSQNVYFHPTLLNWPSTAPLWLPMERGCRGRIGVGATHFPRKSGEWLFGPSTVYFMVWLAEVRNDSDDVISVSMVLVCLSSKPGMCRCWRWPKLFLAELLSVLEWGKPGLRLS